MKKTLRRRGDRIRLAAGGGWPAEARVCCGYYRIYIPLRREGWKVNHKRVHRPYEEGAELTQKAAATAGERCPGG